MKNTQSQILIPRIWLEKLLEKSRLVEKGPANQNDIDRLVGYIDSLETILESELKEKTTIKEDLTVKLSLTSTSLTGPEWIKRLESKGFEVGEWANQLLNSPDFKPTSGVTTEIVILKGDLWEDEERMTENIRAEAAKRGLVAPNAEVACLIRELLTDKEIEEMGLRFIVTMHEPIKDFDGDLDLLGADRRGGSWLYTFDERPLFRWDHGSGFAFAVPQV